MLFQVDQKGKVILVPEALKLTTYIKELDEKQMLFIIHAYDYDSPFKQFPPEERLRKAKFKVYGTKNVKPEKEKKVKEAIEEYISLQFDSKRETIKVYQQKILNFHEQLKAENNPKKVKEIIGAIENLEEMCDQIEQEIRKSDQLRQKKIEGGSQPSLLEELQDNRRLWGLGHEYAEKNVQE